MTKCYKCNGATERQAVTWRVKIGEHEVEHNLSEDVCTVCGEWGISSRKLSELELMSSATALQEHELTGAVLKDVRKSLALKQTELANYLGTASETVSRWERGERLMEPWVRLAMLGLVLTKVMRQKQIDEASKPEVTDLVETRDLDGVRRSDLDEAKALAKNIERLVAAATTPPLPPVVARRSHSIPADELPRRPYEKR